MNCLFDFSDLIALSRFAGERFDLVQAGGGNTSAKLDDGTMFVKASGMTLSEVRSGDDFCCVDWRALLDYLNTIDSSADARTLESEFANRVKSATKSTARRPSIETMLHCILGPMTLHTHPIAVTPIVCRKDWKEKLMRLLPEAILVEYRTPGAPLALALRDAVRKSDWSPGDPACVFLQNHGFIVAASTAQAVMDLTDSVTAKLAGDLNLDIGHYRLTNFVSAAVNKATGLNLSAYRCDDAGVQRTMSSNEELITEAARSYFERHGVPPHVVLLKSDDGTKHLFLVAQSIRKCREMEEVLKAHVLLLGAQKGSEVEYLSDSELAFLTNWEAEKYRQNL